MSSILDALNKLEEEKATREAPPEAVPFEPEDAGDALFGKPLDARPKTAISPLALFAGAGLFAAVIAIVSVVGALWYTKPRPETRIASAADSAGQVTAEQIATPPESTALIPDPAPPEAEAEPITPTEAMPPRTTTAAPDPAAAPAPIPEPEPVRAQPTPEPASTPEPAAPLEPIQSVPQEAPKSVPLPRDISMLPPLRVSDRVRFGLEDLKINGMRQPSANRPYGVAYINMERVYLQETIPGTRAKIIGINLRGIAIEIHGSGERFFVRPGNRR